jgi:GntR family transcriptional regulator
METEKWTLEFHSGIPAYKQIIHHVQAAVESGTLKDGDQLPTIRALHETLGVNPNTVARAYRELQVLGVITAQQGSGCYIAPTPKAAPLQEAARKAKIREIAARVAAEARSHRIPLNLILESLQHDASHP